MSDVGGSRPLVSRLRQADGSGTGAAFDLIYSYETARVHHQGRGWLGFATRTTSDDRLNYDLELKETYSQAFPYVGLLASRVLKRQNGSVLSDVVNTWSSVASGTPLVNERRLPYLAGSVARDYSSTGVLFRTTTSSIASVDATSGVALEQTTIVTENATGVAPGSSRTSRVVHTGLLNDTVNWCLGRPTTTQTTTGHTAPGGASRHTHVRAELGRTDVSRHSAAAAARGCQAPGHARVHVRRVRQRREREDHGCRHAGPDDVDRLGPRRTVSRSDDERAVTDRDDELGCRTGRATHRARSKPAHDELGIRRLWPVDARTTPGPDVHDLDQERLRRLRSAQRISGHGNGRQCDRRSVLVGNARDRSSRARLEGGGRNGRWRRFSHQRRFRCARAREQSAVAGRAWWPPAGSLALHLRRVGSAAFGGTASTGR